MAGKAGADVGEQVRLLRQRSIGVVEARPAADTGVRVTSWRHRMSASPLSSQGGS